MPILGGCLCFDLPTGSKIIGGIYLFLGLVGSIILAVFNVLLWGFDIAEQLLWFAQVMLTEDSYDYSARGDHDPNNQRTKNYTETNKEILETLDVFRTHIFGVKVAYIVMLCFFFASIITSSILIHGIRKRRRSLLVPWLVQEVMHILALVAIIILVFVMFYPIKTGWAFVVGEFISILIRVFFSIVIMSQYQALGIIEMNDEMMIMK